MYNSRVRPPKFSLLYRKRSNSDKYYCPPLLCHIKAIIIRPPCQLAGDKSCCRLWIHAWTGMLIFSFQSAVCERFVSHLVLSCNFVMSLGADGTLTNTAPNYRLLTRLIWRVLCKIKIRKRFKYHGYASAIIIM
jgi:hypothetical protein